MDDIIIPPHPLNNQDLAPAERGSHRERDENYHAVVVKLCPRWRIIVCKDHIQWIIQEQEASHAGPWRGVSFCTTRDGLIKSCGRLELPSDAHAMVILSKLPKYIPSNPLRSALAHMEDD